jgi:hypothetical protein
MRAPSVAFSSVTGAQTWMRALGKRAASLRRSSAWVGEASGASRKARCAPPSASCSLASFWISARSPRQESAFPARQYPLARSGS